MECVVLGREGIIQPIAVKLSGGEVSDCLRTFYLTLAQRAGLSPEKGMSAREVAERDLGADAVGRAASEEVTASMLPLVLDQAGVDAVGQPSIGCYGYACPGEPFAFDVRAVVKPVMELGSYDPVELPAYAAEVSDAEVDAFIDRVALYHPEAVADESADTVGEDAAVMISMRTERNGEVYDPLCFDEKEYRLGKGDMPEGFDEQIIGMKAGERRAVRYTAPGRVRDAAGALQDDAFSSEVTVKSIMKLVPPQIDDAWVARNITGCASVEALRRRAREEMADQLEKERAAQEQYLAACAVADRLTETVPDEAILAVFRERAEEFSADLARQGTTEEEYLKSSGMGETELKGTLMSQARERLRQELALDAVARHEGMHITKAELKEHLDSMSGGQHEEMLRGLSERGGMRRAQESALRAKANAWLVSHARRV